MCHACWITRQFYDSMHKIRMTMQVGPPLRLSRLHQLLPAIPCPCPSGLSVRPSVAFLRRKMVEKWRNGGTGFEPSAKCLASVNRLCRRLLYIYNVNTNWIILVTQKWEILFSLILCFPTNLSASPKSLCWYKRSPHPRRMRKSERFLSILGANVLFIFIRVMVKSACGSRCFNAIFKNK